MRLSVVVPALNEARLIEACLQSVRAQDAPGVEVELVVVDGGSHDGTPALAAPFARVITAPRGRASQMNAGARVTGGDVLLFLHGDTRLADGALAALRAALEDPAVVGGTFTLRFEPATPLLRFFAWLTRFTWRPFRYGDQGIFVRRAAFDALGGYAPVPIMEDVDFLSRLARHGRLVLVPRPVTTSGRRFARLGVVRQQSLNAALVVAYTLGVSPHRLARWYEQVHR